MESETKNTNGQNLDLETNNVSSIGIYTFTDKIMDNLTYFQVLKMEQSFFVWVGQSPCKFGEMAVAMKTKFSPVPTASSIIGGLESPCVSMAQRLAKKTGKQVFVSCDVPYNQLILPLVEKRIGEELKSHPSKFYD